MEGTADSQSTPASQKLASLLKAASVTYTALDVLHRTDLLKALLGTHLPSVPCLFVEGSLLGDLAKLEALAQAGQLAASMPPGTVVESLETRLKRLTTQRKVMLFMKGSPSEPACGFSQRIVKLLSNYPDEITMHSFSSRWSTGTLTSSQTPLSERDSRSTQTGRHTLSCTWTGL